MADAPRDLVHQLRTVDGTFTQLSAGRDVEERALATLDAPRSRSRAPLAIAAAGALALAAVVLLRSGDAADDVAHVSPPTERAASTAPAPAPSPSPGSTSVAVAPNMPAADTPAAVRDARPAPAQLEEPLRNAHVEEAPIAAPLPRVADAVSPAPLAAPRSAPRADRVDRGLERTVDRNQAELTAVAVLSEAEVPAALARLKELRASGQHAGVVALANALLARRLDERERETVSFERARALVRLDNTGACRALDEHARAFAASAADVVSLRERARCD